MPLSFDAIASQFDDQRGLPPEAIAAWLRCVDELSGGRALNVIEPGIGTGRVALPLVAMGHRVSGIDTSPQMLDVCRQRASALGLTVDVAPGDASELTYDDHTFDLGIIAQLLYLVPDWPLVLDELARVVRHGGYVIHLTEPTIESDALQRWSSTWRSMVEVTGYRHTQLLPSEEGVAIEFLRRWPDIEVHELARWRFGQSVGDARDGYSQRLRPLYLGIDDDTWEKTVSAFLDWSEAAFPNPETMLDGEVVLTARIAHL
ncbi:MAG: class I SAM-dependent methyltransferase [Thermomicrobiales bacterium]|nr:class I SAM-dependent methyltransferase [Thermomicrobiales bacterium]